MEQPVGVGFSYADFGETVVRALCFTTQRSSLITCPQTTTPEAAKDIAAFLAIFFESVDGLKGRALHIAGESYAVSGTRLCDISGRVGLCPS